MWLRLSQRSNQFNLRTVRYAEDQIAAIEQSDKYATFSFTLEDKFGDNGLIAVIIMEKKDSETLFIDTWFMSLSRTEERYGELHAQHSRRVCSREWLQEDHRRVHPNRKERNGEGTLS
ncbi:hypothetical protein NXX60_03580 [Bacteroides thetaiotaomicron]|nr:hypothetical protein NXX60_03580 [Bacteroides thetaiotaomicron]